MITAIARMRATLTHHFIFYLNHLLLNRTWPSQIRSALLLKPQSSPVLAQDLQELLYKLETENIYHLPSSHHIKMLIAIPPPNISRLIRAPIANKEGRGTDVACVKPIQHVNVHSVVSGSATQCLERPEHAFFITNGFKSRMREISTGSQYSQNNFVSFLLSVEFFTYSNYI